MAGGDDGFDCGLGVIMALLTGINSGEHLVLIVLMVPTWMCFQRFAVQCDQYVDYVAAAFLRYEVVCMQFRKWFIGLRLHNGGGGSEGSGAGAAAGRAQQRGSDSGDRVHAGSGGVGTMRVTSHPPLVGYTFGGGHWMGSRRTSARRGASTQIQ